MSEGVVIPCKCSIPHGEPGRRWDIVKSMASKVLKIRLRSSMNRKDSLARPRILLVAADIDSDLIRHAELPAQGVRCVMGWQENQQKSL
jgi:hypothetical protein